MAFDFPSSPTVGQTYTAGGVTYRWDGQAWMGGPNTSAGTKVSMLQTPPASPAPGDLWWETDTGNLYVYYDDGNSFQWVQINYVPPSDYLQKFGVLQNQRNILYNGGFDISQPGAGVFTTNGAYFADGWVLSVVGSGFAVSAQQISNTAPSLARGRLRAQFKCTTLKASLAAGDIWQIYHPIEGVDISPLKWGTADAVPAILRVGFKSNIAGTFGISVIDSPAVTRSWVGLITVAPGDVGVDKIYLFAIPATTLGTWAVSTAQGASLRLALASGTTFQGAAGWQAGNFVTTSAQTNGLSATSNVFELFDVRFIPDYDNLGVGNDPGHPVVVFSDEAARCQRYYQVTSFNGFIWGGAAGGTLRLPIYFPTQMRAVPTLTASGIAYANGSGLTVTGNGPASGTGQWTSTAIGASQAAATIAADAQM